MSPSLVIFLNMYKDRIGALDAYDSEDTIEQLCSEMKLGNITSITGKVPSRLLPFLGERAEQLKKWILRSELSF